MIEPNYGKYAIPSLLHKVIQLQEELKRGGLLPYGDLMGLYFSLDGLESRYLNTPLDVISFARPGSDGIHFGFLTDFGQANELEQAYIVRVSPMDFDDPVKIVARNLKDFLGLVCHFQNLINMVDTSTDEELIKKWLKEYPEELLIEFNPQHDVVKNKFRHVLHIEPIESLYDYLQQVKQERENEIVVPTEDGIGVVSSSSNEHHYKKTLFNFGTPNAAIVKELFQTYSYEEKLAFLRDAQSKGLIFDNQELKAYLKEQLLLLHLNDEAARISYPR